MVSFATLLVPLVAAVTFVRCQRWRGPRPMPPPAVRYVLRGVAVALTAVGATAVADTAALAARARAEIWSSWFDEVVGLLFLTGVLTVLAAALLARAWRYSHHRRADGTSLAEQDALDDALALLAEVGTVLGRRLPHLGNVLVSCARRLTIALDTSPLNPRRHPWTFCFTFALLSGTVFSSWHSLVEGVPRDPFLALQTWQFYAGVLASGVVVGYVSLGRYLGLMRHEQHEVRIPPR